MQAITRWMMWALVPAVCMLTVSACRKPADAVKSALQDAGFELTQSDWMRAAAQNDVAVLRKFLDAGFAIDSRDEHGDSALHAAAAAGAENAADLLLNRGLMVDLRGASGRTPLMAAALGGHGTMVRWLLRQGADPKNQDDEGFTPLMLAVRAGMAGPVEELAPYQRENLDSALLLAALLGQAEVIDALTNYGASVYARMDDGRTPLMIAAENGHAAAVDLLLDLGASRFATDAEGHTAADLATAAGHAEITALINRATEGQELTLESPQDLALTLVNPMEPPAANEPLTEDPGKLAASHAASPIQGAVLSPTTNVASDSTVVQMSANPSANPAADNLPLPPLVMRSYRERELPLELRTVEGESAVFTLRGSPPRQVTANVGEQIPGSRLTIVSVRHRMHDSKLDAGRPHDMAVVEVRDAASGISRVWKSGTPASAHDPVALVEDAGTGRLYTAMTGQRFTSADGGQFVVADVRPNQLVIENAATGAVQTIPLCGPKG